MADRALAAVVVVLCVVALALAASTLSATGGLERGPGEGSGPGSSDRPAGQPPTNESSTEPLGLDGGWVAMLVAAAVLLAVPSVIFLGRSRLLGAVLGLAFFGVVLLVGMLLSGQDLGGAIPSAAENVSQGVQGGGEMGSADESTTERRRDLPSVLTFGVVGVALAMAAGLVYYASASVDATVDPEPQSEEEPDPTPGVAEAAGRAADRIEGHEGDPENAVYAVWAEMTTAVDAPDPETSTPGEFADAAVAAGLDAERVDELTDLFERVRYGAEPVTEAHERRAGEILRAIEDDADALDPDAAAVAAATPAGAGDAGGAGRPATDSGPDTDASEGDRP